MTNFEELPPSVVSQELRRRLGQINAVLDLKLAALKHAPAGSLNISICRNNVQYYHRTTSESTKGKYILKKNFKLARSLAQKDYDLQLIRALKKESRILKNTLKLLEAESVKRNAPSDIFYKLNKHRRALVAPVSLTDEQYAAAWQSQKYEGKTFQPDSPEYYTARGERVRSKSEVIIADTLNRLNVPYRYEYPLTLKGGGRHDHITVHPDFLCLNLRTRREFIWEHFGMMDNSEYSSKAVLKLRTYSENGIYPGHNLILSTETADLPLNIRHIEQLIQTYLK